jgi:hypothetical protein
MFETATAASLTLNTSHKLSGKAISATQGANSEWKLVWPILPVGVELFVGVRAFDILRFWLYNISTLTHYERFMIKTYYKIRSRKQGLYIKGTGTHNHWHPEGRVFNSISQVRQFMTLAIKGHPIFDTTNPVDADDWEIQEYTMTYTVSLVGSKNVIDVIKPEKTLALLKR